MIVLNLEQPSNAAHVQWRAQPKRDPARTLPLEPLLGKRIREQTKSWRSLPARVDARWAQQPLPARVADLVIQFVRGVRA